MAHLKSTPQSQGYGFDPSRSLLVLPVKRSHSMYLIAGSELTVKIDEESVATCTEGTAGSTKNVPLSSWEREQVIRRLEIKGEQAGRAVLNAFTAEGPSVHRPARHPRGGQRRRPPGRGLGQDHPRAAQGNSGCDDPPDAYGTFTTIDGNQTGSYRPEGASPYCIDVNTHDANKKWNDGKTYAFAFVHVKTI